MKYLALHVTLVALCVSCSPTNDDGADTGADIATDPGVDVLDGCNIAGHTAAIDWTSVDTLSDAQPVADLGAFLSVWGPCPNDVWTVGGQPDDGQALHFDGSSWSSVELPDGPLVNWVYGFDDDVFMVGEDGLVLRGSLADGFVVLDTPTEAPLWGVWGSAPDDVWAAGGDILSRDDVPPVLLHFDGSAWVDVPMPALDRASRALLKVWGTSADNVFAVGHLGLILYYDGNDWTQISSGTGEDLISLWGNAADNIIAIGGRSNGVVGRWDGDAWSIETLAGVPGMNGVHMREDGTSTGVGVRGVAVTIEADGFAFANEEVDTREVLHATFGFEGGPRFSVGGSLDRSPPWTGVVFVDP